MDNITDNTTSIKYKFVIEETTREVNRVLRNWQLNDDTRRHFETHSMFRSHLSKFLNVKFGWRHYVKSLRQFDPQAIIKDNKLVGISLSEHNFALSTDVYLRDLFKNAIDEFDFEGFNENWEKENKDEPLYNLTKKNWEVTNVEGISFKDIENIKF